MIVVTGMLEPRKRWRRHIPYLRANAGVCAAILAMDLGVSERYVVMMQRKIGLRACATPGGSKRYDLDHRGRKGDRLA